MRLEELTEATQDTIDVTIGYDDHCSIYAVSESSLAGFLKVKSADDMNDAIISTGEVQPDRDDNCEKGDIFFDFMNKDVDEFHIQIKDIL